MYFCESVKEKKDVSDLNWICDRWLRFLYEWKRNVIDDPSSLPQQKNSKIILNVELCKGLRIPSQRNYGRAVIVVDEILASAYPR
jgi:hypothetical protein